MFFDGEFVISQKRTAARVYLKLVAGASCPRPAFDLAAGVDPMASAAGGPAHKLKRKLWGNGHGLFTTQGQNASASVQGTYWLTADYCDSTWIHVRRGIVSVRNLIRHKTVLVHTGQSYYAYSNGRVVRTG